MQQPTLADFDLTEMLVDKANLSLTKEGKLFDRLCLGWCAFCIVLCLLWGHSHQSKHFGLVQWGAFGIFLAAGTCWLVAGLILPYLMPRVFSYHRFHSPILSRHQEFKKACEAYEGFVEEERVRVWREEEDRKKLREDYWFSMDGHAFEHELASILRSIGWRVQVTPGSDDKGIDIFAERDGKRVGIQCKAHRNPVGPATVRELHGSAVASLCDYSILVALGGVTSGAELFAEQQGIDIWTVADVVQLHNSAMSNKASLLTPDPPRVPSVMTAQPSTRRPIRAPGQA